MFPACASVLYRLGVVWREVNAMPSNIELIHICTTVPHILKLQNIHIINNNWILREFPMRTFTTADLNKHVGDVTDAARREPVCITHHRKPRFVLMAFEDYERLQGTKDPRKAVTLETMPADVEDGLLALADQYEQGTGADD